MSENIETNKEYNENKNNIILKYGLIGVIIIIIILGSLTVYGAQSILNYDKIYNGVYIENINVSGLSKEAAIDKIQNEYKTVLQDKSIKLSYEGNTRNLKLDEIDVSYNINDAVSKAYKLGRGENAFKRLVSIYNLKKRPAKVPLKLTADTDKIITFLKDIAKEINIPAKKYTIIRKDKYVKIINSTTGKELDIEQSKKDIIKALDINNVENNIELSIKEIEPEAITPEVLYNKTYIKEKNADYEVKDYKLNIIPHVVGEKIDKLKAKKIIETHKQDGEEYNVPIIFKEPEVLTEQLKDKLLKDSLSKFTSHYNANYVTRSHNIALATSKIDGVILGPGDEFSFNDIVGERSVKRGYKVAHVYFGGEIIDGVGGGICQVSSTTYNAALFSNLEILERSNHSMTVSYVPLGQDAAVSYGTLNLKFKNNTKWPIKIDAKTKKGSITVEMLGTSDEPQETIEIENQILRTIPFEEERVEDPEMYVGEEEVKQNGGNGFVVKSYKITKVDGEVVNKEELSVSRYRPIKKIILEGTKEKPEPKPEPVPFEEEFQDILEQIEEESNDNEENENNVNEQN